jgi:PadR family transcriptional regulator, regulatory protein PadR
MAPPLGEFELMVLLAVLQLGEGAYGVPVRQEILRRTGRDVARGAVYVTLDRLARKGYLRSSLGEATAERGGRPKRFFEITARGSRALRESLTALERMREGLEFAR